MPKPFTLKLEEPLDFDGTKYAELELKPLTAGQLHEAYVNTTDTIGRNMRLISLSAGVPLALVKMMLASDFVKGVDVVTGPLTGGQKDGV